MTITALPNALTAARAAAAVPITALLLWHDPDMRLLAFVLHVAACSTDFLDGWLARRLQAPSEFGRMLDPIADKVLVCCLLVVLASLGDAPAIPAAIIVFRELLVSGLREHLASRGTVVAVSRLARWKTGGQMIAVGLLLLGGPADAAAGDSLTLLDIGQAMLWLAALVTAVTGWSYLRAAMRRPRDGTA